MRFQSCTALVAAGISIPACGFGTETIGPYTIVEAPISATLTSGGGASFNWLNVVNASVSINEAFTGFSVIADGYSNGNAGTTIIVTFAPGSLHNGPGYDLVLFDAVNDGNTYRIAASHNNFASEMLLTSPDFTDTGVDRTYYFGGTGPFTYDVTAAEIDLSSMGVPDGATVDQVRIFAEAPSADPLGIGVVMSAGPVPTLSEVGLIGLVILLATSGAIIVAKRSRGKRTVLSLNAQT